MRRHVKAIGAAFGRLLRNESGSSTIEFVIIFPALFTLFLSTVEAGIIMSRSVMLDRALDLSIRSVRLGTLTPATHEGLKDAVCANALIIPNCKDVVLIELRKIDQTTWEPLNYQLDCVDRSDATEIKAPSHFEFGVKNELMFVRACAVFDPFFPTTGLAAHLSLDDTGGYAVLAQSAFVNEP